MYWQRRYIKREESLPSDSATLSIELPTSNYLSGLEVELSYLNGTTGGGGLDIVDIVSRIEVIANGSQVLFSLTGIELHKWAQVFLKSRLSQLRDDRPNVRQYAVFPVCFGRYFGDPNFYLDLASYNSLELRITYTAPIGATQFVAGSGRISVIAWMAMEGRPVGTRLGYLRTTTVKDFVTASSGIEEIKIPKLYKVRGIMVYCYESGQASGAHIPYLEMDLNNGAIKPFYARWIDLEEENAHWLGLNPREALVALRANGGTVETRLGRIKAANVTIARAYAAGEDFTIPYISSIDGGRITLNHILVEGSSTWAATTLDTTPRPVMVHAVGYGLGDAVYIPFDVYRDIGYALDTTKYDSVKLLLTMARAGGTCRVSVQEIAS